MAIFKEDDWVQITPRPDKQWEYWGSNHDTMIGKFGKVEEIETAPNDPSLVFLRVGTYDEKGTLLGEEWFLPRHVILSTRYDKVMSDGFKKACEELQIWEKKKRQMLDDSLKRVFGLHPEKEVKKKKKKKSESTEFLADKSEGINEWEEDTQESELDDEVLSVLDDLYYDSSWDQPDGAD
jgi:hypothetical protein